MKTIIYRTAMLALAGGLLSACVTINIYFPAAAAEKAADKIIDEVWQIKKQQEEGAQKGGQAAPADGVQSNPQAR
ncbi:MAG: hypothetical protein LUQ69_09475 [Methanoregulaceae archaeon]|nr:hypothetical protein [Methanoregulaceae archaeon]